MAHYDITQQKCITEDPSVPLVVVAGPGSGKTHVICGRIAYLVNECRVPEAGILCLTFTTKAARQMQQRVGRLLGRSNRCVVQTLHALGYSLINANYSQLGYTGRVRAVDAAERRKICEEIAATTPSCQGLDRVVERMKASGGTPDTTTMPQGTALYESHLKRHNICDFADMVRLPLKVLSADDSARSRHARQYSHILIDEFQDTSDEQWDLVRLLLSEGCGVTVVGDVNQSIYAFRGANPGVFGSFYDTFPQASVQCLNKNYRCHPHIAHAANTLIAHNAKYSAGTRSGDRFTQQLEQKLLEVASREGADLPPPPHPSTPPASRPATATPCMEVPHAKRQPQMGGFVSAASLPAVVEEEVVSKVATLPAVCSVVPMCEGEGEGGDVPRQHVSVVACATQEDETLLVAEQLRFLASRGGTAAVLCRNHEPLFALKQTLEAANIPFTSRVTQTLSQTKLSQDVAAYLQLAAGSPDMALLTRILNRPQRGLKAVEITRHLGILSYTQGESVGGGVVARLAKLAATGLGSTKKATQQTGKQMSLTGFKGFALKDGGGGTVGAASKPARGSTEAEKTLSGLRALLQMLSGVRKHLKTGSMADSVSFIASRTVYGKDAAAKWKEEEAKSGKPPAGKRAMAQLREEAAAYDITHPVNERRADRSECASESTDGAGVPGWGERACDFCDSLSLAGWEDNAARDSTTDGACKAKITLATIHGAKGLEWDYVFIMRANEDVTPGVRLERVPRVTDLARGVDYGDDVVSLFPQMKEERRLFYVAMTRAILWVSVLYTRSHASRFVDEMSTTAHRSVFPATQCHYPIAAAPLPPIPDVVPSSVTLAALTAAAASVVAEVSCTKRDVLATASAVVGVSAAAVAAVVESRLQSRAVVVQEAVADVAPTPTPPTPVAVRKKRAASSDAVAKSPKRHKGESPVSAKPPRKKGKKPEAGQRTILSFVKPVGATPPPPPSQDTASPTPGSQRCSAQMLAAAADQHSANARFRVKRACGLCSAVLSAEALREAKQQRTYCSNCCAAIEPPVTVCYAVGGADYVETFDLQCLAESAQAMARMLQHSATTATQELLENERDTFWSLMYHFGSMSEAVARHSTALPPPSPREGGSADMSPSQSSLHSRYTFANSAVPNELSRLSSFAASDVAVDAEDSQQTQPMRDYIDLDSDSGGGGGGSDRESEDLPAFRGARGE